MTETPTRGINKKPLIILALVVIIGIGAIIVAANVNPDDLAKKADVNNLPIEQQHAPTLDTSLGWLNTTGYTPAQLKGKVVVYDFWTYSCINCQRTFPYIRALWNRYKDDGLVIIGIHSPEFDFEKNHSNVEAATKKYKVTWPVLFDDNMNNWNNFSNQYWPAKYIADTQGRIRYHHFGEGSYTEEENVIRKLLNIKSGAPRAKFPGTKGQDENAEITPELYINPVRGQLNADPGESIASDQAPDPNQATLSGDVDVQQDRSVLKKSGSKLSLNYQADEVNLVAEPLADSHMGTLLVQLDGKPVPANMRGSDIKTDAQGNTTLDVTSADLLSVIKSSNIQDHIVTFTAQSPDIAVYSFTFGG